MIKKEDALEYHSRDPKGKLEVAPTKPCLTQRDLSLAYTPGVAEPCREIVRNPDDIFKYTTKGNLVAVVSNGTAVLGLGNIGALAGKPVMEGKAVLFKRFADIDVFDIEINTEDPDEFIRTVEMLEPTFGGINLEDIRAPDCFYIEDELKKRMNIPVFHDDQHGTAIITGAALINGLEIVGKEIDKVRVVFNGAGAAGIACATLYQKLGVKPKNIIMCDSKGVIYKGRKEGMNHYKERFAVETKCRTLKEAMVGADIFVGLSVGGVVSKEMVKSMADKPLVFAMANPDPEITYEDATSARDDIVMATGRSDYPNQINNVLGFPFIFRGALDVRAVTINEEMKTAATMALANLTREHVSDFVSEAYGDQKFEFGRDYIIPKPFDPRVVLWVAPAIAKAAMDSGVARIKINIDRYRDDLEARFGKGREIMRAVVRKARRNPKKIVYPEGENEKVLHAAEIVLDEGIAKPILLGDKKRIEEKIKELRLNLNGAEIIDILTSEKFDEYARELYNLRQRRGMSRSDARKLLQNPNYFGAIMLHTGDADGLISGLTQHYPETIRPALQIIKTEKNVRIVSGMYIIILKQKVIFFADTTVNIDPTAEELAEIAIGCGDKVRQFDVEPRIAMLSFSNFGGTKHQFTEKVRRATEIVRQKRPDLVIDGEMQADTAVNPQIVDETYPFCQVKGGANVLIFPDLQSGNIAYKLVQRLGGAEAIGPILTGMRKPVHLLIIGANDVKDIVNMTAIAVVDAQEKEKAK